MTVLEQQSLMSANILVVDDNPTNLRLLGNILRKRGHTVRLVKDGKSAIKLVLAKTPDLILLDIIMPKVDGYEVCSQLKSNPKTKNIPIIFLSAKEEVFNKVKSFSLGAVDYITKPFVVEEVVARIENHLQISLLSRELKKQNDLLQEEVRSRTLGEQTLRQREGELRAVVENAPDAILRINREFRYLYVNPKFIRDFGRSNTKIIGKSIRELSPNDALATLWEGTVKEVFTTQEEREIDFQARTTEGTKYYSARVVPECSDEGAVETAVAIIRDISDRKQTEEKLRSFNLILENALEGISRLDARGRYIEVNNTYASIAGYLPEEMLGMDWQRTVHPDSLVELAEAYQEMLETGKVQVEAKGIRKDGSVFYKQLVMVSDFDREDNFIGHYCFMKDISDRKKAEAVLRQNQRFIENITESSPNLLYIYDVIENHNVYINRSAANLLGYSSAEIIGMGEKLLPTIMHPEDLVKVTEKLQHISALKDGEIFEHEYKLKDFRGEWRTFLVRELVFARTENGELWQTLATAIDISDRKGAEEEIRLLLQANQAISEAANVDSALAAILDLICRSIDWDWGEAWVPSKNQEFLQPSGAYYAKEGLQEFHDRTQKITFAPGEGLPGRVWATAQTEWLEGIDISEKNFLRTNVARQVGLKTALGVPAIADGRVVAVLVFFKDLPLPKNQQSIDLVEAVAFQLGRNIETKQAQQALKLGEERLQLAIEGGELGIWDLHIETGECYFSLQWKKMLGYKDEEIENTYQSWERLVNPEDLAGVMTSFDTYLRGETQGYAAEFRMRTASGEWKWILAQGKIVEWRADGSPLRMAGTHKDIDASKYLEMEREQLLAREKYAREEAEAARARVTDILESIGDAFFALDRDWKFTYVNQQAELLLQKERSAIMGKSVWKEFPEAVSSKFEREYRCVVSQQVKREFVEFYPPLNAWFEVRAFPAKDGISVYFEDVSDRVAAETALRNSEHFLRTIYEGVATAIFIIDVAANGEFFYAGINPAHERMSGLKDVELKGKTPEEVVPPAVAKAVSDRYRACLTAGERIEYEECLPFQGKDTWWITKLTPLFDSQNRIYRLIGTSFNITDRKEIELALSSQVRRQELVSAIQERVRSSLNLEEILFAAAEEVRGFLKSDRVLIYQMVSGNLRIAIIESVAPSCNRICDVIFPQEVFPQETYNLYREGNVFVVEDIDRTQIFPNQAQFLRDSGIKAKLGIPILTDGELWGLIAVHQCEKPRHWQTAEIESLNQIAVQLAIGIKQSTLYEQAQAEIKERQGAEMALRESQHFVQQIADTSPNLLYIFDIEKQSNIYSNREIGQILGYSSEEIKNMGNNLLPTIIHSDDLAKLPEHFQKFETAKDEDILELEYRLRNARGEWRYLLGRETVFARNPQGKPTQILGTASDVTNLKQTEEALREGVEREKALAVAIQRMRQSLEIDSIFTATTEELREFLQCSRVAIYRFDANYSGEFVAESAAAEELSLIRTSDRKLYLNSDPPPDCRLQAVLKSSQQWQDSYLQETQGENLKDCLVVDDIDRANFNECYLERLKEFKIRAYIIVPIFCCCKLWGLLAAYESAAPRHWKTNEQNVAIEIGNQLEVALQQAELLKQTQEQSEALERAAVAADAANRAKSEFLASMSHELRTPLNAILGFTQLMSRDRALSREHQEQLKTINRAGEHLLALINDILEMSKIEAGRTTLNENTFNLATMLESLESMLRLKAQSKGLQLIFDIAEDLPLVVEADEGKLRQVLINIIGNAIKFTKSGGVSLRAGVETSEPPNFQLRFEIEDTGPGIAPEEMDSLFEAFAQTKTGRESQQGTGLGLPISRKFVELMGGEIRVSSTVGKGTLFSFDILTTGCSNDKICVRKVPEQKVTSIVNDTNKYRILVVDDLSNNRQFLVALLTSIGFEVREAENGEAALSAWSNWKPHLILMDMRMPVIDGYEATKQIKATEEGQTTIVIALTASAFEEERQQILNAGCDDFVPKPFREEVLLEKIGEHLEIKYIYEKENEAINQTYEKTVTTSDMIEYLSAMPAEWVDLVHEAAAQCTEDIILELLEQIPAELTPLATSLEDLANNFQFEIIMKLTSKEE